MDLMKLAETKWKEIESGHYQIKDVPLDPNVQLQFDKDGYVLLWASVLNDYVAFYNTEDDLKKVPKIFTPYNYDELVQINNNNLTDQELRTIHMAKKIATGTITNIEPKLQSDREQQNDTND
jgi:hypothetical protein